MELAWNRKTYQPTTGNKILVIEDNAYVLEAFELLLASSGYETHAVSTGEEAYSLIRRIHFDIIISDYRLPGMDGIEFFHRSKSHTRRTTKILISAFGIEDIATKAGPAGIHYFFEKPFSIQTLIERLPGRGSANTASPRPEWRHGSMGGRR